MIKDFKLIPRNYKQIVVAASNIIELLLCLGVYPVVNNYNKIGWLKMMKCSKNNGFLDTINK